MSMLSTGSFVRPEDVIDQLDRIVGASIADFGCGSGFFSLAFARVAGSSGKVYALDILASSLESVSSRAKASGFSNVITKRVNLERPGGSGLPDESIDWVIMKDILFQNKNKDAMIQEAHRILKVGGFLFVMEWGDADVSFGPEHHLRISRDHLIEMLSHYNFVPVKDVAVGDFHYGLVCQKG